MITGGQFCYWDCKSEADALIMALNSLFTLILLILTLFRYMRLNKIPTAQLQSHTGIRAKYIGMAVWAIISILNTIFAIIVYHKVLQPPPEELEKGTITFYSRVYAFIETTPAMIVQTLLLATAQTMITNGMGVLLEQQHQPTKKEMSIYKFIALYYRIRFIFLASWLMLLFPFDFEHNLAYQVLTQIKIGLLMFDCAIIVYLLRFCHEYMLDKSERLLPYSHTERSKLNQQTKLLIVCGICRFAMNLTFYMIFPLVFYFKKNQESNQKPCIQPIKEHLQFSIGYLLVGTYLMHHLSIVVLLKIYKPSSNRSSLVQVSSTAPINFQQ